MQKRHVPYSFTGKKQYLTAFLLLFLVAGFIGPHLTWSNPLELDESIRQDISIARSTQKREEAWDKERVALEAKILRLTQQKERLHQKVNALLWTNTRKEKKVAKLKKEIADATELTDGLTPLIRKETDLAAQELLASLPFLAKERKARLASVTEWINAPVTQQAEKLERLMEFLTIETEFGHTSESWQQEISVRSSDGNQTNTFTADLLKTGRIAIFYLSLDGKNCGTYSMEESRFIELPSSQASSIKKAIALANRERSAELDRLPIVRITKP